MKNEDLGENNEKGERKKEMDKTSSFWIIDLKNNLIYYVKYYLYKGKHKCAFSLLL